MHTAAGGAKAQPLATVPVAAAPSGTTAAMNSIAGHWCQRFPRVPLRETVERGRHPPAGAELRRAGSRCSTGSTWTGAPDISRSPRRCAQRVRREWRLLQRATGHPLDGLVVERAGVGLHRRRNNRRAPLSVFVVAMWLRAIHSGVRRALCAPSWRDEAHPVPRPTRLMCRACRQPVATVERTTGGLVMGCPECGNRWSAADASGWNEH
jgi:hypothetical protein